MDQYTFTASIIYWRGPAPFYFAAIPADVGLRIAAQAKKVSYGWGVIPVTAEINGVSFRTSLFPKDGSYLLPLKVKVRAQLGDIDHDAIQVGMTLG